MFGRAAAQILHAVQKTSRLNAYCVTSTRAEIGQVNKALVHLPTLLDAFEITHLEYFKVASHLILMRGKHGASKRGPAFCLLVELH